MKLIIDTEQIKELLDTEWGYKGIKNDLDNLFLKNGIPLDKIRAEIERKIVKRPWLDFEDGERARNDAFLEVLDIIDKYKTESEEVNDTDK